MFDPRLFDVAKARQEERLAVSLRRQEYRLVFQNSNQCSKKQYLYARFLKHLGSFLVICGQRLAAQAEVPEVSALSATLPGSSTANPQISPSCPCCS